MTDQQKVREAFNLWHDDPSHDSGPRDAWESWQAAWQAALAHASSATAEECSVDALSDWLTREMPAGTVIGDPAWWAKRIAGRVHLLASTNHAPSAEDARDAARYRLLRSAKDTKGFWIAHGEYGRMSRWNAEPADKAIDQALAAERGEGK